MRKLNQIDSTNRGFWWAPNACKLCIHPDCHWEKTVPFARSLFLLRSLTWIDPKMVDVLRGNPKPALDFGSQQRSLRQSQLAISRFSRISFHRDEVVLSLEPFFFPRKVTHFGSSWRISAPILQNSVLSTADHQENSELHCFARTGNGPKRIWEWLKHVKTRFSLLWIGGLSHDF